MDYCRIFKIIAIFIIITLGPSISYAQKEKKPEGAIQNINTTSSIIFEEPEKKDPFIAGVLSWSWCGLGQFYTQNYKKGSAFLLADITQKGLLVYMLFHISDTYAHGDEDVKWSNINKMDQYIVVGLLCSLFFTRLFSVVDAVNSAHDYNREIYYPYWKSKQKFSTLYDPHNQSIQFSISQSINFK